MAYKASMKCSDVQLKDKRNTTSFALALGSPNATDSDWRINYNYTVLHFTSDDGCSINIYQRFDTMTWLMFGGGWWAKSPSSVAPILAGIQTTFINNDTQSDWSGSCGKRSFISYNTPGTNGNQSLAMKAHICSTEYLEANVTVTVSMTEAQTSISLNQEEFAKNQKQMDPNRYSLPELEDAFFSKNWAVRFPTRGAKNRDGNGGNTAWFGGPIMAIAAGSAYSNSGQKMVDSPSIAQEAGRVQQQFFGQMLLSSLSTDSTEAAKAISGQVKFTQRRIAAILGIGVTLGLLFLISSVCILGVAFYTRLGRRPLNLHYEPGSIAVIASMIVADEQTRATLEGSDRLSMPQIKDKLRHIIYSMMDGTLYAHNTDVKLSGSFPNGNAIIHT
jgi:hypothetical protein